MTRQNQHNTGELESLAEQAQQIFEDPAFRQDLLSLAKEMDRADSAVWSEARAEFSLIAARPKPALFKPAAFLCRLLIDALFSSVEIEGLDELKESKSQGALVLVSMHRSHLDYVLIGYELYRAGLLPPLVASGTNLNFFPIGPIFRRLGSYFVRRAEGNKVHSLVLKHYVNFLLRKGFLQEFFIEGGRSRSGKMLPPKTGMLRMLIEASLSSDTSKLSFIPVSISYENVVEARIFGKENTGVGKKKESLFSLLNAFRVLGRKHGHVLLKFGSAVAILDTLSVADLRGSAPGQEKLKEFALTLTRKIRDQVSTTLSGLAHLALMSSPTYGLDRSELVKTVRNLHRVISLERELNPEIGSDTEPLRSFIEGEERLIDEVTRPGVIQTHMFLTKKIFFIPGSRRFTGDFYKNSVLHLLTRQALLSLAQLADGEIRAVRMRRLHQIFQYDLLLPEPAQFEKTLAGLKEKLANSGIIGLEPKIAFISFERGIFIPYLLISEIQAQIIALYGLIQTEARPQGYSQLLTTILQGYSGLRRLGFVSRTESTSQAALNSAFKSLEKRKLIALPRPGQEAGSPVQIVSSLSEEYEYLNRLNLSLLKFAAEASSPCRLS